MTGLLSVAGSTPSDDAAVESTSCRFEDGDSAYLDRTQIAGNRKTWTWSCWAKRCVLNATLDIFGTVSEGDGLRWYGAANNLNFLCQGSSGAWLITDAEYRDVAAWYHIVVAFDTTQPTAANRVKLYVNGVQETSFSSSTYPSQNSEFKINNSGDVFSIGRGHANNYLDGYLAEVYFTDGEALGAEYFGETNSSTGQWQPLTSTNIKPTVTFGPNGFYLPFSTDTLQNYFVDSSVEASTNTFTPTETLSVDVLLVGGGGGGWGSRYGAGGAGGMVTSTGFSVPYVVVDGEAQGYPVVVGFGGPGQIYGDEANQGGDSTFSTLTAFGGGGGVDSSTTGTNGGCGSGGTDGLPGGSGSQGGDGGSGSSAGPHNGAGGGGGAGGNGGNGTSMLGGDGGVGLQNLYRTGSNVYYAGGGGGGKIQGVGGTGGNGGGGTGGGYGYGGPPQQAYSGVDNLGGGGGGGSSVQGLPNALPGGSGGCGIVVIRYLSNSVKATGGTITTYGSAGSQYYVHTFLKAEHKITESNSTGKKNQRVTNHTVVANGNANIIGPKIGSSAIAFAGTTSDRLYVAASSDFNFGTSDWTLECFVNCTKAGPASTSVLLYLGTSTYPRVVELAFNTSTLLITTEATNLATTSYTPESSAGSVRFNEWYHVALVKNGSVITIYINGVSSGSATGVTGSFGADTTDVTVGCRGSAERPLDGYMDEIRVSDSARYTADFTPPTTAFTSDSNTMLLIPGNGAMGSTSFDDLSPTDHTVVTNGDVMNVVPKIGVGMGNFDGTTDYLSIPSTFEFAVGTGDFTMEGWFYHTTTGVTENIFDLRNGSTGYKLDIDTDNYAGFYGEPAAGYIAKTTAISSDAWHHVAVVRVSGTIYMYLDGTQDDSGADTNDYSTSLPMIIGARYNAPSGDQEWTGYMDEVRISRTARYTTTFTPSTTAFKDDKDTVLLLHMDGGGGIDPETLLPTLPGEGTYFWDASVNAIFYDSEGVPTNKSFYNFNNATYDVLKIANSDEFNIGASPWTMELWYYIDTDTTNGLFCMGTTTPLLGVSFRQDTDSVDVDISSNGTSWDIRTGSIGVDPPLGTWSHLALVFTGSAYLTFFNGTLVDTTTDSTVIYTNGYGAHFCFIGNNGYLASYDYCDGNIDQVRISDSARYSSTFTPSTTPFTADSNTLLLAQSVFNEGGVGGDHSGNYNYMTPTNLTTGSMVLDSPTNNFPTWNYLTARSYGGALSTFFDANLRCTTSQDYGGPASTFAIPRSGKWYAEFFIAWVTNDIFVGVFDSALMYSVTKPYDNPVSCGCYRSDGQFIYTGGSSTSSNFASYVLYDIIGIAVDMDNDKLWLSKNNVWQGDSSPDPSTNTAGYSLPTGVDYVFGCGTGTDNSGSSISANWGQDSSFNGAGRGAFPGPGLPPLTSQGNQDAEGKGDFQYAPPTDFLALCSDNLPDPSINKPVTNFNTILYDDGAGAKTGVGFQPDLVWVKSRGSLKDNKLTDAVRGTTKAIVSNDATAETTDSTGLTAFGTDGFTVGADTDYSDTTGTGMVAWSWLATTTFDPATAGTVTTGSGRSNSTAGFSIVKYTAENNVAMTIGHGLSQAPELIIVKSLDGAYNWAVYSSEFTSADYGMQLNTNIAEATTWDYWDNTDPTASVFTVGTDNGVNYQTEDFISYCFHSVEGYSKVGKYIGNGSADGTFFQLGFRPAFILLKRIDGVTSWYILDNKRDGFNINNFALNPDYNYTEAATTFGDFVSNGIKWRTTSGDFNPAAGTFLYYAVAESPFKTANAR